MRPVIDNYKDTQTPGRASLGLGKGVKPRDMNQIGWLKNPFFLLDIWQWEGQIDRHKFTMDQVAD